MTEKGLFCPPKEFLVPKLKGTAFIQPKPTMTSSRVDQGNLVKLALVEHISCLFATSGHGSESGKSLECVAKVDITAQGARTLQIVPEKTKIGSQDKAAVPWSCHR